MNQRLHHRVETRVTFQEGKAILSHNSRAISRPPPKHWGFDISEPKLNSEIIKHIEGHFILSFKSDSRQHRTFSFQESLRTSVLSVGEWGGEGLSRLVEISGRVGALLKGPDWYQLFFWLDVTDLGSRLHPPPHLLCHHDCPLNHIKFTENHSCHLRWKAPWVFFNVKLCMCIYAHVCVCVWLCGTELTVLNISQPASGEDFQELPKTNPMPRGWLTFTCPYALPTSYLPT